MIKDFPLSGFIAASQTALGGVLAFYMGLFSGGLIVMAERLRSWEALTDCSVLWLALIPYTVAKGWGLLLLPALGFLFWGVIWRDWNRLVVGSNVAILLAATTLLSAQYNPFARASSAGPFLLSMGPAVGLWLAGIVWEILKWRLTHAPKINSNTPPP